MVDGAARDLEGDAALRALPSLLGRPDSSVWVDLAAPSAEQVEAVGRTLSLHPLIVEDVLEGNQRAKIETTDGVVHIVLFALDRAESVVINEVDLVLGLGFLLSVHDVGWDPRESSTGTSRTPTGSATRSTRSRTRSSATRGRRRWNACSR
jgi:Mg2+ and Co2+ transporter CorA